MGGSRAKKSAFRTQTVRSLSFRNVNMGPYEFTLRWVSDSLGQLAADARLVSRNLIGKVLGICVKIVMRCG